MQYFYHWDGSHRKLYCHPGKLEGPDAYGEYKFETCDASRKTYLHCKADGSGYKWSQITIDEKNSLLAVEKLIEKGEYITANQKDYKLSQSHFKSIEALKELRDKLSKGSEVSFKGLHTDDEVEEERYITLLDGYQVRDDVKFTLVTNAGDCGSHCCGVFDAFEEAVGYMMKSIWYYKNSYKDDVIEYTIPELMEGEGGYISTLTHNGEWYQDYYILFIDKEKG